MNRQEYRSIIGQLPIKNPTPEDMAIICPHLTKEEATKAFTTGSNYVVCPPLRIRNGFQVVSYKKEWVEEIKEWFVVNGKQTQVVTGTKNHPARLDWSYAGRTLKSYTDGKSHGDIFPSYKHMNEAIKFAEANWGEELILDDWYSFLEIYIGDPTDLVNDAYHHNYPRTKAVLYMALNREFNDLINDHSKPESELFDEALSQATTDQIIGAELKGGRGGYTEFNCAYCGAGLGLSSCTGCGHTFRDDLFRGGWSTPLSRKMVTALRENGHEFKVDPEIAWAKEKLSFERSHQQREKLLKKRSAK